MPLSPCLSGNHLPDPDQNMAMAMFEAESRFQRVPDPPKWSFGPPVPKNQNIPKWGRRRSFWVSN